MIIRSRSNHYLKFFSSLPARTIHPVARPWAFIPVFKKLPFSPLSFMLRGNNLSDNSGAYPTARVLQGFLVTDGEKRHIHHNPADLFFSKSVIHHKGYESVETIDGREQHNMGHMRTTSKKRYHYASLVSAYLLRNKVTEADVTAREIAQFHQLPGNAVYSISAMLNFLYNNRIRDSRFGFYITGSRPYKKSDYPHHYTVRLFEGNPDFTEPTTSSVA
jgi:hypothetical protein